jgi:zinc transport system ATP-binding protein
MNNLPNKNLKPVVEVQNVTFAYDRRLILEDASLRVYPADFLSIVGPNGSGKSTVIKIMLGLLKPEKGTVKLFGREASSFKDWRKLGYLAQKATSFNPTFPATVREVVGAHTGSAKGLSRTMSRRDWEVTDAAIEKVGLAKERNSLVGRLSGGQQQRVFLARILVNKPEVVLLDEPLVGIDRPSQEALRSLLLDLHQNHQLTIIMVTHDITYASATSTRLVCIHNHGIYEHDPLSFSIESIQDYGLSQLYHFH